MRLGRIVIAGLAPLFGLSAFAATLISLPENQSAQSRPADPLPHLFASVLTCFAAAEHTARSTPLCKPAPNALLGLEGLRTSPLGGSLWLVQSSFANDWGERRHQRNTLRC
jgi:hypothetical protein